MLRELQISYITETGPLISASGGRFPPAWPQPPHVATLRGGVFGSCYSRRSRRPPLQSTNSNSSIRIYQKKEAVGLLPHNSFMIILYICSVVSIGSIVNSS